MKKLFTLVGLSFFLLSACNEDPNQDPIDDLPLAFAEIGETSCGLTDFKYYNDAPLSLGEMSNDYIYIGVDGNDSDRDITNHVLSTGFFDHDQELFISNSGNLDTEFKHMVVKLRKSCNCGEIAWVLNELMEDSRITFAHYTFQSDPCGDINLPPVQCVSTYSNYFYVKVKDPQDLTDLNATANATNTEVIHQNEFMDNWFTLKAGKDAQGDAMKLANFFYETGLFDAAEPDNYKRAVESQDP